MAESIARWTHHDDAIRDRVDAGLARATAEDWSSGSLQLRTAELQAVVIDTAYQMAKLQGTVSRLSAGEGAQVLYIDPRQALDVPGPRVTAAATLYRTLNLLAHGTQQAGSFETWATPSETGAFPAVVTIALIVVGGAAIGYLGLQAAKVVDRYLERDEDSRRLTANHAAVLDLVAQHTEREDKQGKQLPLDAATRAAIDALAREQQTIAKKVQPPIGGGILPPGTDSPWTFASGAILGLAFGVGVWVMSKTGVI